MKSDVVMVAIVSIWDFIFMLLGLDLVLYILGYLYILYVTLFRLIVLYSRCRVKQDKNMSVVCVLCNFLVFCFHCACLGACVAFPTCGVHPHYVAVCSIPSGFGACNSAALPFPPPLSANFALFEPPLGGLQVGCEQFCV